MNELRKHPDRVLTSVTTAEQRRRINIEVSALTVNVSVADMMLVALIEKYCNALVEAARDEGLYKQEVKRAINDTSRASRNATAALVAYEKKAFPIAKYLANHRHEYDADGAYTAMVQVEGAKMYGPSLLVLESVCKNSSNRFVPKYRRTVAYALLLSAIANSGIEVYKAYCQECGKLLQAHITPDMGILRHYNTIVRTTESISVLIQCKADKRFDEMIAHLAKDGRQALTNFQHVLTDILMTDMTLKLYERHERDYIRWYCARAIIDCHLQGHVDARTKEEVKKHIGQAGMAQFCAEAKRLCNAVAIEDYIDDPTDLWDEVEPMKHKYMDELIFFYTNNHKPVKP